MCLAEDQSELGGAEIIRLETKTALYLWYTANQNSDRELSEKFDIFISRADDIVEGVDKGMQYGRGVYNMAN